MGLSPTVTRQAKPAPKPALDDAKLDDEAQKDYQKFIALKQRKVGARLGTPG